MSNHPHINIPKEQLLLLNQFTQRGINYKSCRTDSLSFSHAVTLAANRVVYGPQSHSVRNSSAVCVQFPFPSVMSGNFGQASLSVSVQPFALKHPGFVLNFIAIFFFESQRAGLILRPLRTFQVSSCESAIIFENYLKLP